MANEKNLLLLSVVLLIGFSSSSASYTGDRQCAKGITFWCEHVMNAKKCNAIDFCIQTVWQTHSVKIDTNPLCDDCKDWVKQARDLITNKETSDKIIGALELSCELCPNTNGRNKCKQLIEDNVHEIIKLLESQMDPDAVCSAIHLCNNAGFTEMFAKDTGDEDEKSSQELLPFTCGQCSIIGAHIESKFKSLNHDEILEGTLKFCGETSSFSDSCVNVVWKNSDDVVEFLQKQITRQNLCSATCAGHNQYSEGIVSVEFDRDSTIPCTLCEQLMLHLRELLIANTTEIEFKNVLEGFCSQMPVIEDECVSITEQYYDHIYQFLVNGLDANKTCVMIGICNPSSTLYKVPPRPLLSNDLFPAPSSQSHGGHKNVEIISDQNSLRLLKDGKWCTACEYAMNLVHIEMGKDTVQNKIAEYARKACKTLPMYVKQCEDVMDMFGDEIANAIYHSTDPRLVCSTVRLCPPNFDLNYLEKNAVSDKPTCPFCLLAMEEIHDIVQSNTTKENIERVLKQLCSHLSDKLKNQCEEFVKAYSAEVVDMILANFTPQESCVFIRLCSNDEPKRRNVNIVAISSESSEDVSINDSSESEIFANPQCQLCKVIIQMLEERVINIKSKDEIKRELENSCSRLKKFAKECKQFVDKYSDRIVDLVSSELKPEQVCRDLIFCVTEKNREFQDYDAGLDILKMAFSSDDDEDDNSDLIDSTEIKAAQPGCVICEFVIQKIEDELNDHKTDDEIKHVVKNICSKMPSTVSKQCNEFVDYYFDMIIALIETSPPQEVCAKMALCTNKLEEKYEEIKQDVYTCAVCKGVVEVFDTIIEDPQVDINLENLEEKICEKFAGKFKDKCHNLASTYGIAIINLLKNLTESDQVCFKLDLCANNNIGSRVTLT